MPFDLRPLHPKSTLLSYDEQSNLNYSFRRDRSVGLLLCALIGGGLS